MGLASENRRMFWVFSAMRQRCNNPMNPHFNNYGGRGIYVDPRWNSFEQFIADMGPRPDGFTIERSDNNGPYSPENCQWVPRQKNNMNKRDYRISKTGVRNVEKREDGTFRVRIRRFGMVVFDKTTADFFEACCLAKSFQQKEKT